MTQLNNEKHIKILCEFFFAGLALGSNLIILLGAYPSANFDGSL